MKYNKRLCPICRTLKDMTYPALSRKDNKTKICSDCGRVEALNQFYDNIPKQRP